MNRDPLKTAAAVLLLVALAWGAFGGALQCGFVHFDDDQYVFENPAVARGWTAAGVRWAFTTGHAANWHPLTWLAHMADVELFGLDARAHHAVNVWLHAMNAGLLFFVLRRLTGRGALAWWVAALWCVHPLRAESVVWISERKDVLAATFGLAALWAYAGRSPARLLWTAGGFALSLMAKPTWVTLPFLLLLLDVWPLARWKRGAAVRLILEKGPLFALALASSVATFLVQRHGGAVGSLDLLPPGTRVANALVAYAEYVRLLVWPSGLAVLYPYPDGGHAGWRIAAAAAVVLGLSFFAAAQRRRRPWWTLGGCWFLGTLVPMIGLVQVGRQSWADRYTYLPHVGLILAAVWSVDEIVRRAGAQRRWLPRAAGTAAAALVLALALGARRQTAFWRTNESLFGRALAVTENNLLAHGNLGTYCGKQGRWDQAEFHFGEVLRRRPEDGGARYGLGNAYLLQGRRADALREYRRAAEDPRQWEAMNNVAWFLATAPDGSAQAEEALRWADRARQAAPPEKQAGVWDTLSVARANAGDFAGAIAAADKAAELARAAGDAPLAARIGARLARYRQDRPWREAAGGGAAAPLNNPPKTSR